MKSALPYKDFTIKARVRNLQETENRLKELDTVYLGTDFQTDHYFETPKGKLKWREGKIENLITHYERVLDNGMERTVVYRYDLNPSQSEINALVIAHKAIGITTKVRQIYQLGCVKIHLDKLPSQEEFIEIEVIDRHDLRSVDELRAACLAMKLRLNIHDDDLILTGYFK